MPAKEALALVTGDAALGAHSKGGPPPLSPATFRSPFIKQQQVMTPSWVKYPSFYDPCETEGVLLDAETCGLTEADFHE
jgi:hypothetical protein